MRPTHVVIDTLNGNRSVFAGTRQDCDRHQADLNETVGFWRYHVKPIHR